MLDSLPADDHSVTKLLIHRALRYQGGEWEQKLRAMLELNGYMEARRILNSLDSKELDLAENIIVANTGLHDGMKYLLDLTIKDARDRWPVRRFGKAVKKRRQELGYTVADMAVFGIPANTLLFLEKGYVLFDSKIVAQLASLLKAAIVISPSGEWTLQPAD